MILFPRQKAQMVEADRALPGRQDPVRVADRNIVLGTSMVPPFPEGSQQLVLGMGCFWGTEEIFWQAPGVISTAVGYAGGYTPNATYEEVCSGRTGHTEVALVVYDPSVTTTHEMLRLFWEQHDPTQGMRQGNDLGSQYRSAIYWADDAQRAIAEATRDAYAPVLAEAGYGPITTEIDAAANHPFFYAEDYHQQYLAKNPNGYRCHSASGLKLPSVTTA
jgi:peptide-methionine (S)-S-oxide reductase